MKRTLTLDPLNPWTVKHPRLNDDEPLKTPSHKHSLEEIIASAYIADTLGVLPSLRDVLLKGDANHQSDAAFDLGRVLVVYEHDQGWFHPPDRIDGDIKKTNLLLESNERIIVVRSRINAPPLPFEHPRCILVDINEKTVKPGLLLTRIASALAPHVPEPFAKRLREAHGEVRKLAEMAARELHKEICPDYEEKVRQRRVLLDANGLQNVDTSRLVGIPLDGLENTIAYLMIELGLTKEKVASREHLLTLNAENNLKPTVAYLTSELGMTMEKMVSRFQIIGEGLDTKLKPIVAYLTSELGMEKEKIASFPRILEMSMENRLKPVVAYLTSELGIKKKHIALWPSIFMKDVEKDLKPTVAYLTSKLGITNEDIVNLRLISRDVEKDLKPMFAYLNIELGITMKKIASNTRLFLCDKERLKHNYAYLKDELSMSDAKIKSQPQILRCDKEKLNQRYAYFKYELGMSHRQIASQLQNLGLNLEYNVKPTVAYLTSTLGMKKETIASHPSIIGSNIDTLKKSAAYLISELGIDKTKIANNPPSLLDVDTLKTKVVSLKELGFDEQNIKACVQLLWKDVEGNLKETFEWIRYETEIGDDVVFRNPSLLLCKLETLQARYRLLQTAQIPMHMITVSPLRNIKIPKAEEVWATQGSLLMNAKDRLKLLNDA